MPTFRLPKPGHMLDNETITLHTGILVLLGDLNQPISR